MYVFYVYRQPGTLAHADGALTMLGFCHAPPADDVIRPKAAHVIYRQKRLKQKTRSLNMTKTAFKHDVLIKRVGGLYINVYVVWHCSTALSAVLGLYHNVCFRLT